jgi:hypothetical protein
VLVYAAEDVPVTDAANWVGGGFQFDVTTDGRPIKIVSIIDEHTRECLGGWSSAASPAKT